MERAYRHSMRAFSALILVLGLTVAVLTVAEGGGAFSYGVIVGVLLAALGAARLYLAVVPRGGP